MSMWFKKSASDLTQSSVATAPKPTPEAIAEAKRNPNGWVYVANGAADANGRIPPERIVGAWKVNENGEIVGDFIPNLKCNPSAHPI